MRSPFKVHPSLGLACSEAPPGASVMVLLETQQPGDQPHRFIAAEQVRLADVLEATRKGRVRPYKFTRWERAVIRVRRLYWQVRRWADA